MSKIYTCVRCGNEFEAKRKTAICKDCKIQKCIICGKEFELKTPYTALTCSPKCRGIYRKESGIAKASAKKASETVMMRYGVKNSASVPMKPRKCAYCGEEFVPSSSRQKYCKRDHYGPCPVCGKPTKILDMQAGPKACSEECRQKEIEFTNLKKYGVKNVFQSEHIKNKIRQSMIDTYGVDHYSKTEEYKTRMKSTMIDRYGDNPFSSDEILQRRIKGSLDKYGTMWPSQNPQVKQKVHDSFISKHGGYPLNRDSDIFPKIRDTNLIKYGFESPIQNETIRNKMISTNLERYGVENPAQNNEIRQKIESTNLSKYGVTCTLNAESVKMKIHETIQSKYGVDNVFQSSVVKQQIRQTLLDRYGVDNPMKNESIREKAKQTNIDRYGSENYVQSDEYLSKRMTDPSKLQQFKDFKSDPASYLSNIDTPTTLHYLSERLGVNISTVSIYIIKNGLQDFIKHSKSNIEESICDYIHSIDSSIKINRNNRKFIYPDEIDIYLPEYSIGIECDPTYTHNSSKSTHWSEFIIPPKYHQDKTLRCQNVGIQLIHIFGYEWTHKQEIVKSMIRNLLHKNIYRYYARKLDVRSVPYDECHRFLESNHIQGNANGKVRLGLYDGSTLISCMVFSHPRAFSGYNSSYTSNTWELIRFCTLKNSTCIGGASKLFKYFIHNYNPDKVISFSDTSNTSGSVYAILGFNYCYTTPPNYVWVEIKADIAYNRVKCRKSNLRKLLNDSTIDIDNQTEAQIMESHGFVKVYNSGLIKWEYVPE